MHIPNQTSPPSPTSALLRLPALIPVRVASIVVFPHIISTLSFFILSNLLTTFTFLLAAVGFLRLVCYHSIVTAERVRRAVWAYYSIGKRCERFKHAVMHELVWLMLQPAPLILVLLWPGWVVVGVAWWMIG